MVAFTVKNTQKMNKTHIFQSKTLSCFSRTLAHPPSKYTNTFTSVIFMQKITFHLLKGLSEQNLDGYFRNLTKKMPKQGCL